MAEERTAEQWKAYFLTVEGQENTAQFLKGTTTAAENDVYRQTPEGIGRYAAMRHLYDSRPRPDALDRAQELMLLPMNQVPAGAFAYAKDLSARYGMCGDVILSGYTGYAQYAEGLPNPEGPSADAEQFFAKRGELKRPANLSSPNA